MNTMWSPWRSEYIDSFLDTRSSDDCFMCMTAIPDSCDDMLLKRSENCIIMMNRYPYNAGHILIAPNRHCADLLALTDVEYHEIMHWNRIMIAVLTNLYKPHGFNVGFNLGIAAGAGVPGHLHLHIVPRWNGDTNFMTSIGDMKVISSSMKKLRSEIMNGIEEYLQSGLDFKVNPGEAL